MSASQEQQSQQCAGRPRQGGGPRRARPPRVGLDGVTVRPWRATFRDGDAWRPAIRPGPVRQLMRELKMATTPAKTAPSARKALAGLPPDAGAECGPDSEQQDARGARAEEWPVGLGHAAGSQPGKPVPVLFVGLGVTVRLAVPASGVRTGYAREVATRGGCASPLALLETGGSRGMPRRGGLCRGIASRPGLVPR